MIALPGQGLWALRQDKCATFEAPFLFLLVGSQRALLIDAGDLDSDAALLQALDALVPPGLPLLCVSTHPHSDHVAGFGFLRSRRHTEVLEMAPEGGSLDLGGGRVVEVFAAGSGHSDRDVCFLDVVNRLLFTGDVLYPGYLYVRRFAAFVHGIRNVHRLAKGRYDWSLGAHCEMSRDGRLFPSGARYQPDEAPLQQPPAALDALLQALDRPFMTEYFALTPKSTL